MVKIKTIKTKGKEFLIELVTSDIKDFGKFSCCDESALSGKGLLRIKETNKDKVFYNPYGEGQHLYDFDLKNDLDNFIKNNKNKVVKDANDYFVLVFIDVEMNEITGELADIIENKKNIDKVINIITDNIII